MDALSNITITGITVYHLDSMRAVVGQFQGSDSFTKPHAKFNLELASLPMCWIAR